MLVFYERGAISQKRMAIQQTSRTQRRRSIRLPGYDYTQPGAYFVTICAHERDPTFGQVVNDEMVLSENGRIAQSCWGQIPAHSAHVELDAFVVMPNHIYGIIVIRHSRGETVGAPLQTRPAPGSLGVIIRSFKSAVTREINRLRATPGAAVWQRNYWEHIIRSEEALQAIRRYIEENPLHWALDTYNPAMIRRDPRAVELWRLLQSEGVPKGNVSCTP